MGEAEKERAAVVIWLRDSACRYEASANALTPDWPIWAQSMAIADNLTVLADMVEAGHHLRPDEAA